MARRYWFYGILVLALSACGNDNGAPPPPANVAPVFTSAPTSSVVENTSGNAYLATANDANGDALTFTISGGADAARFTITSSGAVQFTSPPNFDAPTDANGDNAYLIELTVSDGRLSATQSVEIKVTNSTEGVSVHRVATGVADPVALVPIPDDTKLLLAQKNGNVSTFDPLSGARALVYTLSPPIVDPLRDFPVTLLGLAAAPDYQTSGGIYAVVEQFDRTLGNVSSIRYYYRSSAGALKYVQLATAQSTVGREKWVGVGPDGYVYILSSGPFPYVSSPNRTLSAVQRFAKNFSGDCAAANCFVPAPDNPYLTSGGEPSVFHYGLKYPNGGSFYNGFLLFADPQGNQSEINMASLTTGGSSFGYPYIEGTTRVMPGGAASPVDPVILFDDGSAGVQGVIGGFVYIGPIASLSGKYIFGTSGGQIRAVSASSLFPGAITPSSQIERREQDFIPDMGTLQDLNLITHDQAGNIWLVTGSGDIFNVLAG